ncbi:Crp/Fnr family transcriptional regulator [Planktothrix sp. FACHB-1365]|uniref:Crp/Fnr family transcriptional regulator n=1 Tax=Planktothrix sp. FACHB-1365 TaxID=2692855 RepID=UPI001681E5F4|nr:Crp/Fnr family transcriptional regulator [Planktothrix sp. FACHB-1365]MBD2484569.1 Crp/Fnr family transcriptional regulator [Planktothrix sp. FACHB-1365]
MTIPTLVSLPLTSKSRTFSPREQIPLWSDALWKIERGVVRTLTWTEEGTLIILGYWGQNDVVGKPLSQLQPYQIECVTSVEVSLIASSHWSNYTDVILTHLRQTEELQSILHTQGTEQRLLNCLRWLGKKFGRLTPEGLLIDLRLTHADIADVIGTTRVSVTRMIIKLEQDGFIQRPRRHFIVLNQL